MSALPFEKFVDTEFERILNERLPEIADDDAIRNLSEVDQTVFLIVYFDCQVFNGGFEQWLRNPTGAFTNETIAALERSGAYQSACLIREVHSMFPGVGLSRDYDVRINQLECLSNEQQNRLGEMSDAYTGEEGRESGNLFELVHDYVENSRINTPK